MLEIGTKAAKHEEEIDLESRVTVITEELNSFAATNNIPPLGDRVRRGLDPIGIMALKETQTKIQALCERMGANFDQVLKMTIHIQVAGPWEYGKQLKEATDPNTQVWMIMNTANTMGKERELDMTNEEFVRDLDRIHDHLDRALDDPSSFFGTARQHVLEQSRTRFHIIEDVPIAEMDNGFIPMAVDPRFNAGIIHDADGMLFVGAREVPDDLFLRSGLRIELREDRGRPDVPFFVNDRGEAIVKKLFPGFVVVLSRSFGLAREIVQAVNSGDSEKTLSPKYLGHTVYIPTSMEDAEESSEEFLREARRRIAEVLAGDERAEATFEDKFYEKLFQVKSTVIAADAEKELRRNRAASNREVDPSEIKALQEKTQRKSRQKIEELKYMLEILEPALKDLPPNVSVMDMAGGAGDLGLATTMKLMEEGKTPQKTRIIDPMAELELFTKMIIDNLPRSDEFNAVVKHEALALQDVDIPDNAIVIAKHACGDLTDTIIENWVQSKSPMLVIMTCCQDKAKDKPARYDIPQDDWKTWCKASAKTNSPKPAKREQGMEAMTRLDEARVQYLQRHGCEATLHQTNKFPKGDVIVAKRKR